MDFSNVGFNRILRLKWQATTLSFVESFFLNPLIFFHSTKLTSFTNSLN